MTLPGVSRDGASPSLLAAGIYAGILGHMSTSTSNLRLASARGGEHCLLLVVAGSMFLAGCFPIHGQQYNASTGSVSGTRIEQGCHLDGGTRIKLPARISLQVEPPTHPDKAGETVSVGISIPGGHTAHFSDTAVRLTSASSGIEWTGTLSGTGSTIYDVASQRVVRDHQRFLGTAEIVGGTAKGSWIQSDTHDGYGFTVESDRPYPASFSMQLPALIIDGRETAIPVVNFRYGNAVALCGCCGV